MAKTEAASDGSKAREPDKPTNGLIALREKETRGLISLACDAMSQTHQDVYALHEALYNGDTAESDSRARLQMLNEALSCLRITEHYLMMLNSIFEEQARGVLDPWSPDRVF